MNDTIVAIATPAGSGALGMIRVSGEQAIQIVDQIFSKSLYMAKGYTLHYGQLLDEEGILDEVIVSVFRGPKSFTREDVVEISCHGSSYVLERVIQLLLAQGGRLARAGEFTQRAYLNGAMDLAQAEAVADLIASGTAGAHQVAMQQMRGGVSDELKDLRTQLLNFTSLIELELDFSEEDVEFANRDELLALIHNMQTRLKALIGSFRYGNALKKGVPTVIVGKPNAGKSTLLNALLNEQRAIVSDIPGTTRDVIEDRVVIEGVEFRLMDTAGLRETQDVIEAEGVNRSLALAQSASLVLYVFDVSLASKELVDKEIEKLEVPSSARILKIGNKIDLVNENQYNGESIYISAVQKNGIQKVQQAMLDVIRDSELGADNHAIISNIRHVHALQEALKALTEVERGIDMGLSGDLLSIDIRTVLHHIGEITGEISTDEVLGNIFSKFCIGK